jgi:endoglucanase
LQAVVAAWNWAKKNPNVIYDQEKMNQQFQPKIVTGEYGDNNVSDEFFWAACELFTTTRDEKYYTTIAKYLNEPLTLPSWSDVHTLGAYTLLRNKKLLEQKYAADINALQQKLIDVANNYVDSISTNAFKTVMGERRSDFVWGSNANAANQSILLINAYFLTQKKEYINAALTNLDYLLGRNATGYCFVTGIGTKSTLHPHHRPSVADGIDAPVPGLMAGGPNPGRQDGCHYDFFEPETAYSDISCAYASNEIAINWNAPLVYVANAIEALQSEMGY